MFFFHCNLFGRKSLRSLELTGNGYEGSGRVCTGELRSIVSIKEYFKQHFNIEATYPQVLRLYRRILTLHRQKLDRHMRILGDQYVRDEFKRHKTAAAKFVPLFLSEWEQYSAVLARKENRFGQELSAEEKQLFDNEQKQKLRSLQDAAKKVGDTIA
ncbi:protein acn9 mitochondrial [Plasmopara halstedii]|uniref:Succinate dehydrogenase assembly factor 3 n=1 Tax=Plasmopara halstedii TaxID=4781 RepID=A0A0N7L498_PLAHL|nr:protein acn9 mitochondrial [Plasmopara halstedii]CEG38075.1 protein acn9 mitochondrial [Plasmopara halstedii]|eukprot:XP_024574444.1 protein acn9 mitochondrial [Plasmopara halstedii]